MYTVEDETFVQARSVVTALARELATQLASGAWHPVDLRELVRRGRDDLRPGDEAAFIAALADKLEKSFPIAELFPRRRRADAD